MKPLKNTVADRFPGCSRIVEDRKGALLTSQAIRRNNAWLILQIDDDRGYGWAISHGKSVFENFPASIVNTRDSPPWREILAELCSIACMVSS
jgi:hypothetical protein